MIQIEERDDITPLCPHCSEPLRTLCCRSLSGLLGRRYVYFCAVQAEHQPQGSWCVPPEGLLDGLAVRGASPASHREWRCARLAGANPFSTTVH